MPLRDIGMSEKEARTFLDKELGRHESQTSFYWESEETEEVLDLVVGAVAKLLDANNRRIVQDMKRNEFLDSR